MMGRRCLGSAVREGRLRSCGRLIGKIWRRGRVVLVAVRKGLRILFRRIRLRRSSCGYVSGLSHFTQQRTCRYDILNAYKRMFGQQYTSVDRLLEIFRNSQCDDLHEVLPVGWSISRCAHKSKRVHIPPGYPNSKRQTPKIRKATVIFPVHHFLETLPKHVSVDLAVNFSVHVDHIHIALRRVADDGTVEHACVWVLRNVDAQRAIDLEFQPGIANVSKSSPEKHAPWLHLQNLISFALTASSTTFYTFSVQSVQLCLERRQFSLQSFSFHLNVVRALRDSELLRIER
jgi:hypothetical protein